MGRHDDSARGRLMLTVLAGLAEFERDLNPCAHGRRQRAGEGAGREDGPETESMGLPKTGESYPAGSLTGKGTIDGYNINCLSPEQLVKFTPATSSARRILTTCRPSANASASNVRRNTKRRYWPRSEFYILGFMRPSPDALRTKAYHI
jgi:hypothetical protein